MDSDGRQTTLKHVILMSVFGVPILALLMSPLSFSQASFHQVDNIRGMRHHGLVERVSRNRLHSPLHRPVEKHGRQISFKVYEKGKEKLVAALAFLYNFTSS